MDPAIARRAIVRLEQAASRPVRSFRRLISADEYKLRIGDLRLLAVLDPESRTVLVERIDHLSRVYRRRA